MLISLTVGKVDAGLAILLTEDKRLIEFPSILLPANISSGSIVDIQVSRNTPAEQRSKAAFQHLQDEIYNLYGITSPSKPVLRIRNATQTSVVLEWDPIELATASLRSLTLYRNNSKAGAIPNPTNHTSTKISGLAVDTEYSFHLVLRTSAGTYSSEKLTIKTHKMTELSGITVCPGPMPAETKEILESTLTRIGAKPLQASVKIDTTHFVCTEGRGPAWERAQEMNIPVVRPEWVEACEREGRIVGVRAFYLGADMDLNKMRQGGGSGSGHRGSVLGAHHRASQSLTNISSPVREYQERRNSRQQSPALVAAAEKKESPSPPAPRNEAHNSEAPKTPEKDKGVGKDETRSEEVERLGNGTDHHHHEKTIVEESGDISSVTPTKEDGGKPEEGFVSVQL